MSPVTLDPAAMAWLAEKGGATRVHRSVDHFLTTSAEHLATLGETGAEMAQGMVNTLVAGGVMIVLIQQLHRCERMDAEGLRILRQFLEDYPHMLPHFQAQAQQVRNPNHREMFNTLLARAQAA